MRKDSCCLRLSAYRPQLSAIIIYCLQSCTLHLQYHTFTSPQVYIIYSVLPPQAFPWSWILHCGKIFGLRGTIHAALANTLRKACFTDGNPASPRRQLSDRKTQPKSFRIFQPQFLVFDAPGVEYESCAKMWVGLAYLCFR